MLLASKWLLVVKKLKKLRPSQYFFLQDIRGRKEKEEEVGAFTVRKVLDN